MGIVERKYRRDKKVKAGARHPLGKHAIPTDYAVGLFMKHAYANKDVKVDMILPHEVNPERLKKNDINFMMIYDTLEAFHTDKTKDKKIYKMVKKCLETCDNVYPPHSYAKLIYSKIEYYNFLMANNVSIAPALTMPSAEYKKLGAEKGRQKIIDHAKAEDWESFICKPVLGMEGIDAEFFTPGQRVKLNKYLERCMNKYPGIVMPNGKKLPKLLTRIDMGYIVDGKYSPFVNEVEFAPSVYAEDCAHHPDRLIDAELGH